MNFLCNISNKSCMMALTTNMNVYDADFSAEHEYSNHEIRKEFNDDWNQVKGIQDYSYEFAASFLTAIKKLRKEEIEQKEIQKQEKLETEQKIIQNTLKEYYYMLYKPKIQTYSRSK